MPVFPSGKAQSDASSASDVAFQREVIALRAAGYAGCHHPHIGNLLGTFESESSYYIVLELVEGLPLFDWIVQHGVFFREATASTALRQVVEALAHIHSRHICHNDIKPENVLVSRAARARVGARGGNPDDVESDPRASTAALGMTGAITNEDGAAGGISHHAVGSGLNLKLIDFGMAHVLSGRGRCAEEEEGFVLDKDKVGDDVIANGSTRGGLRRSLTINSSLHSTIEGGPGDGTFAYWAPEMMCGKRYGVAVDMWALGVTLYIALCGVHPFDPRGVSSFPRVWLSLCSRSLSSFIIFLPPCWPSTAHHCCCAHTHTHTHTHTRARTFEKRF